MNKKPVIRTCCACRKKDEKQNLLRFVRLPDGNVVLDPEERRSGRSAYVCKNAECVRKARMSNAPGRSLKCSIPETIWDEVEKEDYGK